MVGHYRVQKRASSSNGNFFPPVSAILQSLDIGLRQYPVAAVLLCARQVFPAQLTHAGLGDAEFRCSLFGREKRNDGCHDVRILRGR